MIFEAWEIGRMPSFARCGVSAGESTAWAFGCSAVGRRGRGWGLRRGRRFLLVMGRGFGERERQKSMSMSVSVSVRKKEREMVRLVVISSNDVEPRDVVLKNPSFNI
jgi:hypothetical protein